MASLNGHHQSIATFEGEIQRPIVEWAGAALLFYRSLRMSPVGHQLDVAETERRFLQGELDKLRRLSWARFFFGFSWGVHVVLMMSFGL